MAEIAQSKKPILVTGGTGFLGRPLVEYLVQRGEKVRVIGRSPVVRWRHNSSIDHIRADISETEAIEMALEDVEQVYHLAAATQGGWATYQAVTIHASAQLLKSFANQGGGRIIFVSSLGNYDGGAMRDGVVVDESFPLERNPKGRGFYARAKVEADHIAQPYLTRPSVKLTIVRPGVVYGPGMKNPLVGIAFSVLGKVWAVPGTGDKPIPWVYIDDVVQALVHIMENDQTIGHIYNIVHPQMPTQNQYLALYHKLSGDPRPVIRVPLRNLIPFFSLADRVMRIVGGRDRQLAYKASRLITRTYYSGDRLKEHTGFQPQVDLEEGLHRMFDGMKARW